MDGKFLSKVGSGRRVSDLTLFRYVNCELLAAFPVVCYRFRVFCFFVGRGLFSGCKLVLFLIVRGKVDCLGLEEAGKYFF